MAKGKKAKTRADPSSARQPKTTSSSPVSSQGESPVFCFKYADRRSPEPWAFDPSDEHSRAVLTFICDMAALTWGEIEQHRTGGVSRRAKHHSQQITTLAGDAQKDLRRSKIDETFGDEMFRFRLAGEQRLWGFRSKHVFHVVWWDQNHQVYPTEPN